jgi:hypothetical protein
MPPAVEIMRQRAGADLAQTVEFGDVFNSNDYITITHILETTKEARGENPSAFGAPGVYSNILKNDRMSVVWHLIQITSAGCGPTRAQARHLGFCRESGGSLAGPPKHLFALKCLEFPIQRHFPQPPRQEIGTTRSMESKVSNGVLFAYWQNLSQSHEAWIFFLSVLQIGKQLLQIELIFLGDRIFLAMHLSHDFVDAWLGSFNSFHH